MLAQERHKLILKSLWLHGQVRAADIATELGVSEITVRRDLGELSRQGLLRRVHGGAVSAETERRHANAEVTIGIVVPASDFYYTEAIRGAEAIAKQYGARLVLGASGYDPVAENERIDKLLRLGVEGILISTAYGDSRSDSIGDKLDKLPVPIVLMERSFSYPSTAKDFDHVRTDHAYGVTLAVRHLAALGHTTIGVALHETVTSYWLRRGLEQVKSVAGVTTLLAPPNPPGRSDGPAGQYWGPLLEGWQAAGVKGVLVHSDAAAASLVEYALEQGLRVPEDLAVIAYDDETAALAAVPLTAVSPPKRAIGQLSCELLLRRLRSGSQHPSAVQHLSLLPQLKIRDSCGARPTY